MRVQRIQIDQWRHFAGVDFELPEDAPIVCIVGANGTGKSQILALIAACAAKVGLAAGFENMRGDPFHEQATFAITFSVARDVIPELESAGSFPEPLRPHFNSWDRSIVVSSTPEGQLMRAGGMPADFADRFAQGVAGLISSSRQVHYLSLDADRAYHKVQLGSHQLAEAYDRDWGDEANKQSSFKITRNLYEEWFRFLIGRENQENNRHIQSIRVARDNGQPEPRFNDQFDGYKNALRRVLPHLLFVGVDPTSRQIRFDSTGIPLIFDQLSGGERELAFLVGQVERFGLKRGLLLVDEPELHLNFELLRAWIGFLKESVDQGQIWLATHSLEVVEATGKDATILLHRDDATRQVTAATPLNEEPMISTLSRAVGSPAFSISNLAFVMIEGEAEIGERERFRQLCEIPPHVRFLEAGSCNEVVRRIDGLRQLSAAAGQQIRIGGVIDRDWRSSSELRDLSTQGVFVLGLHEVENFFLHPPTLGAFLQMLGRTDEAEALVLASADQRAGRWIFESARADRRFKDFPAASGRARELAQHLAWDEFVDVEGQCDLIAQTHENLDASQILLFKRHLIAQSTIYERKRVERDIWRVCEGKEVFRSVLRELGFMDNDSAERALTAVWKSSPDLVPPELNALRQYILSI